MSMKAEGRGSRNGQGEPQPEMQIKSWAIHWGTPEQRSVTRGVIGQKYPVPSDLSLSSHWLKTETDLRCLQLEADSSLHFLGLKRDQVAYLLGYYSHPVPRGSTSPYTCVG